MARALRSSVLALILALAPLVSSMAQAGSLAGKVTNADGGKAMSGVLVSVVQSNAVVAANAVTRSDGSYRISGISPGTYLVRISLIGYTPKEAPNTVISSSGTATVDAVLAQKPMEIEQILVTVPSRVPQKQTDAPAAAFVVSTEEVQERPALTIADHLKSIPGADVSQGGLVQSNIVARGFNNIFSGALLTLIDYRYAAVPSLRVNVPTFFPTSMEDIEKIEFVLGPGAALYGPNADNGVLNIITKSPFTSVGTTLSLEGGARAGSKYSSAGTSLTDNGGGIWRVTGRHAMRLGSKVAFKVSGNYLKGTEWRERDPAEPTNLNTLHPELQLPAGRCNTQTGCRDFNVEQWGGEARVDVRPDQNSELVGTYGLTDSKSLIEYTGIGAAQSRGWRYSSAQLRFRYKRFFVQGFGNFSGAGIDSSGSAPMARAFLLRDGSAIVDQSRVWSAQFQHGFDLGTKETVLYGGDYIYTDARTGGTINGANENDDNIKEIGGYVHSITKLTPKLDFVAALRLDKNSRLEDVVWSPRAALLFKPDENQAFRVTFNRAYSTPSNNNLFLDIVAGRIPLSPTIGYNVRALGVPKDGFQFRVNGGCVGGVDNLCMRTPFNPAAGVLPANARLLWSAAVAAVLPFVQAQNPQLATALQSIPVPTTAVGTQLRTLNPTTQQFVDVAGSQVTDIAGLKPTISHAIEVGYKALIGGKLQISVDGWYEHKRNFTGPLIVESPTVFLDRATTKAYLKPFLAGLGALADTTAGSLATIMAGVSAATSVATTGVPLGTVVPTNTPLTARPDIFLTYRNFGKVNLWGSDLALDYVAGSHLSLSGSYSYVNKDFFPRSEVNGPTDIALNASKSKGSVTVGWRDDVHRWSAEARVRALKGFPVNSGVYVSAPDPANPGKLLPTDSYGVLDLQGTWRPPVGARNLLITANLQNVANKHYATFVGVPNLGRLLLTKLTYTF